MIAYEPPAFPNLLPAVVLGLLAAAVWFLCTRPDFVIRVRHGQVRWQGKVPQAVREGLAEFLLQDLSLRGHVTICGRWRRDRVETWFRGGLTPGQRQRIRNYLQTRL
jgi:hypothetical protein